MADNFTLSQKRWFSLNEFGIVTVVQSGIYMVYAQVINAVQ